METIFIYLLKSGGLITVFFLAYYFLLRKETFFDSNRWFLLAGLFTSLLLPLFFIKRIVYVERPKININDFVVYSQENPVAIQEIPAVEAFDWVKIIWVSYVLIASLLVIKIIFSLVSLYRMLHKQQVIEKENFKHINLNKNIAPFSFFNYIVFNADLYSDEELNSILLHEKVHSREKHSADVLIAKLFCTIFWFNPFVWLYKKAILQNLEYIADQKAMHQLEDKKSYQRALLKVVSYQNCLSVTNNFYQSLIKKRIVMLNKNQSHKRNLCKYAVIIPALIGFVFLFQTKIVAQEKPENPTQPQEAEAAKPKIVADTIVWKKDFTKDFEKPMKTKTKTNKKSDFVITREMSDSDIKSITKSVKDLGIDLEIKDIKRNKQGEINAITIKHDNKKGHSGIYKRSYSKSDTKCIPLIVLSIQSKNGEIGNLNIDEKGDFKDFGEYLSSLPAKKDSSKKSDFVAISTFKENESDDKESSFVYSFSNDGDEKKVIAYKGKSVVVNDDGTFSISGDGENESQITIKGKTITVNSDGIVSANGKASVNIEDMKKMARERREEMLKAREELLKSRKEITKSRQEIKKAMEETKALQETNPEVKKAREEMLKARKEMERAKLELEKTKKS